MLFFAVGGGRVVVGRPVALAVLLVAAELGLVAGAWGVEGGVVAGLGVFEAHEVIGVPE